MDGKLSLLLSADFGKESQRLQYGCIPFSSYQISELKDIVCRTNCCHTMITDQYFNTAEEKLSTKYTFLRIKNLAVHAKYTALDCRLDALERLRKAFKMLTIAEGLAVFHVPLYSLEHKFHR